MEDILRLIGKDFNFAELLCFALLWRIEGTLKATTDAINQHLSDIQSLRAAVERVESMINNQTKG